MNFAKVRNVKSPTRANEFDAGIDFFVPEFDEQFIKDFMAKNLDQMIHLQNKVAHLSPHARVLIPSGIKVNVPKGYALIAHNKSGVATKKGLDVMATVVDHGYSGECHISLVNTSNDIVLISGGEKIVQFILMPILTTQPNEVPLDCLYDSPTDRGDGGFGSSGTR